MISSRHSGSKSPDFMIEGWPVHVLKGPDRLLGDLFYISFTGDFGLRYGFPLPAREVIEEHVRHEKRLLSHFAANIINLEFILPGTGGDFRMRKQEFDRYYHSLGHDRSEINSGLVSGEGRLHRWYRYLEMLMLDVVCDAGFQAVSLANNHINDYGPDGILYNEKKLSEAGMLCFGSIKTPYVQLSRDGQRAAVFGMTDLIDTDLIDSDLFKDGEADGLVMKLNRRNLIMMKQQIEHFDVSVAFVQLISQSLYPSSYELEQIDALIDAGFGLIVCTGSHWIKGFSMRRGIPVIFGLGNYLFSYEDEYCEPIGMHVVAGLRGRSVEQILAIPFHNRIRTGIVGPLSVEEFPFFMDTMADRSDYSETKYFHDARTFYELKRSISSYGFLPTKTSLSDLWGIGEPARLHRYYMFRTVLSHMPKIIRSAGRQVLMTAKQLLSLPFVMAGGAIYVIVRSIPFLRKRYL